MDRISRDDLTQLVSHDGQPKVSIYMPTYRAGREVRQNAIRYKNLLKQVVERLVDQGLAQSDVEAICAKARELETNDDWWQHQADGLAVFFTRKDFLSFRLPVDFKEHCAVGSRFHLAPIVPVLQDDGQYYVLAVSQNHVRLLSGSKLAIAEIEPDNLPSNLRSALNIDEYMSTLQHHSAGAGRGDAAPALFHGQGGSDPDVKKQDEILQFFRRIDSALEDYFHSDRKPLVFAGVDYLFPLFQRACHYRALVDEPLTGNPDKRSAEELHKEAWPLVQPLFDEQRSNAVEAFSSAKPDLATADILEVVRCARDGQVDTLLYASETTIPGTIDADDGTVTRASDSSAESEDLINAAAVYVLANSGRVFSIGSDEMPGSEPVAAILRYPLPRSSAAATAPSK